VTAPAAIREGVGERGVREVRGLMPPAPDAPLLAGSEEVEAEGASGAEGFEADAEAEAAEVEAEAGEMELSLVSSAAAAAPALVRVRGGRTTNGRSRKGENVPFIHLSTTDTGHISFRATVQQIHRRRSAWGVHTFAQF